MSEGARGFPIAQRRSRFPWIGAELPHGRRLSALVLSLLGLVALGGCGQADEGAVSGSDDPIARALAYLESTRDELGPDVAFAVHVLAQRSGDARAQTVARALRERLRPRDREAWKPLWGMDVALPPALGPRPSPPGDSPTAAGERGVTNERIGTCLTQALECRVEPVCIEFALDAELCEKDLTHQALWVIFALWRGCETGLDLHALRATLALRILAEHEADPRVDDLGLERLAMLAELGAASWISEDWLAQVRAAQRPSGCFPADDAIPCHPHPTGLVVWLAAGLGGELRSQQLWPSK